MFVQRIGEVNGNAVAEQDRIRYLHHRRFKMQRQKQAFFFGDGYLLGVKRAQGIDFHR